jgi:sugar lactone lactonase YvrE
MLLSFSALLPSPAALGRGTRRLVLAAGLLTLLPACSDNDDEDTPAEPALPARISVPQAGVFPEGVQYDESRRHFLVSSRTLGRIGTVKDDSTYIIFADDPRLVSTIGLHLDAARQRLLAAVSDNGNSTIQRSTATTLRKQAAVAIYNSTNGSLLSYVDLGGLRPNQPHFANDIAVDKDGNAYITDSLSPLIYKVDLQGNATVFLENAQLAAATGFGLNGIVYHPDGYLLVAKTSDGTLFKVPLSNPASFTKVTTSQNLTGADGLLLFDNQTLLLVSGSQSTVFRLTSPDAWATTTAAGTFATGASSPTTITRRAPSAVYVLYPFQSTAPRFAITKVSF